MKKKITKEEFVKMVTEERERLKREKIIKEIMEKRNNNK